MIPFNKEIFKTICPLTPTSPFPKNRLISFQCQFSIVVISESSISCSLFMGAEIMNFVFALYEWKYQCEIVSGRLGAKVQTF